MATQICLKCEKHIKALNQVRAMLIPTPKVKDPRLLHIAKTLLAGFDSKLKDNNIKL